MISKVSSGKNGQVIFHFSNGVKLSMIWDWGSYSDNSMERPVDITKPWHHHWISTTVEVYSIGENPNGIDEYLLRKYDNSPAGYVPVNDIPKILARADKGAQ